MLKKLRISAVAVMGAGTQFGSTRIISGAAMTAMPKPSAVCTQQPINRLMAAMHHGSSSID
jgi:hypothetical protein